MRPGLANAFLISFIESIADFGNPIVLGGNFGVLSTEIFFSVVGAQLDQGRAATLGIVLLLFALGAFFVQRRVLGRKVYTALSGKGDAGLPTPLPTGVRRACYAVALPWAALTVVDLRDGARSAASSRRGAATTRRRCKHYVKAFGDRMGRPRHHLVRRRVELVLDDGRALGDRRAAHRGARHPGRVPPDAAALRRPGRVRVRHDAVVRDSGHRDRRRLHPRLQRAADRDHRHRADPHRLQRLPQHAGRRARRHGVDGADRPQPRRGVGHAAARAAARRCDACCCRCCKPAIVARARLQLRARDDDRVGRHLPGVGRIRVGDDVHHQPRRSTATTASPSPTARC